MFRENFLQAVDSEQKDSGPDISQVLFLLLSGTRDGGAAGQHQGPPPQQIEDGNPKE